MIPVFLHGQNNMGIGTLQPDRLLDVEFSSPTISRIHSTTGGASMKSGLMLIRAGAGSNRDFQLLNADGHFSIRTSLDDFASSDEIMRLKSTGEVGLGLSFPVAKLHILGDEDASNSTDGYLVIGSTAGKNLVLDPNEIIARDDGVAAPLIFQADGGDVILQNSGGNSYFAPGSGYVLAGNAAGDAKLNIGFNGFQLHLRNEDGGINEWFIGASESTWQSGDNQLLFSPQNLSNSAIFRLTTTTDNDGDRAPVVIQSSANQALLIDGNEIDSKYGPLHFNYNSQQNTYMNTSGGDVAIGTSNPGGDLHVRATPGQFTTTLENNGYNWNIHPYPNTDNLGFRHNGVLVAHVDDASGAWVALSDKRFKTDIREVDNMLNRVRNLDLKAYAFKFSEDASPKIGFLAQQVKETLPELVSEDAEGNLSMSYSQFSVVAIKALQEQEIEITALEAELKALLHTYYVQVSAEESGIRNISPSN